MKVLLLVSLFSSSFKSINICCFFSCLLFTKLETLDNSSLISLSLLSFIFLLFILLLYLPYFVSFVSLFFFLFLVLGCRVLKILNILGGFPSFIFLDNITFPSFVFYWLLFLFFIFSYSDSKLLFSMES